MAGTLSIFGTQQFKPSGAYAVPISGGKLYTLAAGETNTPQTVYQDVGLTIAHPNPITLDESGFVPPAYVADGYLKYRLTDADGVTIREYDNQMVVGPSSGSGGGGGGGVDPTTVFATGYSMWQPFSGSLTGWVRENGRTIGSATSGATERANPDCEPLFSFIWNNYSDTLCPVSTGRGVSASADWSANKTIQLLDFRNCAPAGLDDMGNSAAGGFANVPVVTGGVTTAGSVIGESLHTLTEGELAQHDHTVFPHDPQHDHDQLGTAQGSGMGGPGGLPYTFPQSAKTSKSSTGITLWSDGDGTGTQNKVGKSGSNTAHNNVQKTVLGTFYRKL